MSGLSLNGTGLSLIGTTPHATNLAGGVANQIPYQSAPNTTTFATAPTIAGTVLSWDGAAFAWARYATATGVLTPNNIPILTATGIADSGVALLTTLPAYTLWGNLTAASAAPLAVPMYGPIVSILGSSGAASAVSSGTAEVQLASVTVPANSMGANGKLRITTTWSYTNSVNAKTLRIRLGGSTGTIYLGVSPTTSASRTEQIVISNNNSTGSQKGSNAAANSFGISTGALTTSSVNTTAATTVDFSGQPASAGETITLESYTVELIPGI